MRRSSSCFTSIDDYFIYNSSNSIRVPFFLYSRRFSHDCIYPLLVTAWTHRTWKPQQRLQFRSSTKKWVLIERACGACHVTEWYSMITPVPRAFRNYVLYLVRHCLTARKVGFCYTSETPLAWRLQSKSVHGQCNWIESNLDYYIKTNRSILCISCVKQKKTHTHIYHHELPRQDITKPFIQTDPKPLSSKQQL